MPAKKIRRLPNSTVFYPTDGFAPRGLSRIEAAAYVGLSASAFGEARRQGKYPNSTLPGGRYDRILLNQVVDRLSGIAAIEAACAACVRSRHFGDI